MAIRESAQEAVIRWAELKKLQALYPRFETFLQDVIEDLMGFQCSALQIDIGRWMESGPQYRMVQAQRGQAKTTIAASYAVWRIIHDPTTRILLISAGSDMAEEISGWIMQIIMGMPQLECLRPDRSNGDRTSVTAFDVHYSLKGPEKSPTVACLGITSNLQGKRADVLIPDDVESSKNSQTAVQRERLRQLTLDFSSICSNGDILWLGTPQSVDSIYNGLPGRGVAVRIWTGRFPTAKELPNYGEFLAPSITAAIAKNPALQTGGGPTGDRGQPTDPLLLSEETLTKKEIDQGAAYFQLQHMLDTKLMDEDRYPLKSDKLILFKTHPERAPTILNWSHDEINRVRPPQGHPLHAKEKYYRGVVGIGKGDVAASYVPFTGTHMYVDPSGGGQNGDEISYGVTRFVAGYVYLVDVGGRPGGLTQENYDFLTAVVLKHKPGQVDVEENYGKGAFRTVWQPHLLAALKEVGHTCKIEDVWEQGQKELRIIDTLEPIIGSGRFVVNEDLLHEDWASVQKYAAEKRMTYSFFWQLSRITRDKGSLIHDDRLDAVAGSARHWVDRLALDRNKAEAQAKAKEWRALVRNPLGDGRPMSAIYKQMVGYSDRVPSVMDKFSRRRK